MVVSTLGNVNASQRGTTCPVSSFAYTSTGTPAASNWFEGSPACSTAVARVSFHNGSLRTTKLKQGFRDRFSSDLANHSRLETIRKGLIDPSTGYTRSPVRESSVMRRDCQ